MKSVLRIIDANANRAREALRVMEEAARFLLDDPDLTQTLKSIRHDFTKTMKRLEGAELHRDTPGDVGTRAGAESEFNRATPADVIVAAGKRLAEALRAIEEYGKTIDSAFARQIEAIRYRGYDAEQRLARMLGSGRRHQWRVCVLLTESLCRGRDWRDVAGAAIANGADCLQLREKDLEAGELLARARSLVELARGQAAVIVNDRPDVALLSGADGVHLGQHDLPCVEVRKLAARRLIVGVSTSRLDEAKQALRDGADYCGVGPMFDTATKHKDHIVGPAYLREFVSWGRLPHLAIGGVSADNVHQLIEAGCRGVAVSSAVCGADDPGEAVRRLHEAVAGVSDRHDAAVPRRASVDT